MAFENIENSTLKIWNANTSIFSLLIYILYFIVYRLSLSDVFAYSILLFGIINIGLIIYTLFLIYKFKNKVENLPKNIFFGSLRIIINLLLVYLILDYVIQ